jgi:hypothetical protein
VNPEHVKILVARRMQQAVEALDDGRYLLAAGRGARTVVNRAYYACFVRCWRYCKQWARRHGNIEVC